MSFPRGSGVPHQPEEPPIDDWWPPRTADGKHGATYEWDGPNTAVRCRCGFYRITDTFERAELEYMNHIPEVES